MNKWIGAGLLALVSACDVPQAPVVTGPDGQPRIQISTSGLTCYENRCLNIDPARRTVSSIGSRTIRIPDDISVSDGTITPAQFKQLGTAALLAGGMGSREDRD